ncbi:hypothetical protein [Kitasatospora brasiliensis]|uniref:hypothetical protein n=1 Tax=Kitasatospora brasiliensis TaxID=3058040 RepID=UPI00292F4406|nr:hypothetical protein [Kitasatospora sp. K002]
MGLPLAAGHVLVRLGEGPREAADAVLDALEAAFPTHTGRGRTLIGNVWEDPATVTSEGIRVVAEPRITRAPTGPAPSPSVSSSQAFDAHRPGAPGPPLVLPGGLAAELLGGPEDVERVLGALAARCPTHEVGRERRGPQLAVRLRLGSAG